MERAREALPFLAGIGRLELLKNDFYQRRMYLALLSVDGAGLAHLVLSRKMDYVTKVVMPLGEPLEHLKALLAFCAKQLVVSPAKTSSTLGVLAKSELYPRDVKRAENLG